MKRILLTILVFWFVLVASAHAQQVDQNSLLVRVTGEVTNLPAGWTIERAGQSGFTKLLVGNTPLQQALQVGLTLENVTFVSQNPLVRTQVVPNDPQYKQLWAMPKISAPAAWDVQKDSPTVVVAVIDTGVELTHEDLQGSIWRNAKEIPNNKIDDDKNGFVDDVNGWDFVSEDNDPSDDNNHGTHCAGTVGALGNNGKGVAGVTWRCQIMPLKFLGATGGGTLADAIQAIDYAAAMGAHISNNSWGGSGDPTNPSWLPLKQAIELAGSRQNHLAVFAAGNSATNNDTAALKNLPASWDSPNILSVAASTQDDLRATFSSYGATTIDVAAPGVNILSLVRGGKYMELQGTSMAAPHVAGLAALLKQRNPSWGHAQLKARVIDSVDRLIAWNGVVFAGGRINAQKALGQAPPPGNRPPVAVDDAYETVQNAPLLRNPPGVLANDTDPDGDTLTAKLKRAPTSGAVDMTAQGAFLYRPNQDFRGLDTFTYEASDGKLASEAKVSIVVTPKQANRPPVAQPDTVIGEEPGPLTGNVLANDTDPDGDPMFASLHAGVARGKLDFDERDGSFTYRPNPGFTGQDGFAYRAVDPHGGVSAVTPVTLKVNKRAQPPSDDELRRKALETMQALIDLLKKLNP